MMPGPQLSPAEALAETGSTLSDDNFIHGFFASLSVIIVSELGDKTFFIAAILSMKHPRLTVFAGAILALSMMHVMASFFGYATTVIPRLYTYYISSLLFAIFGLKMLHEGYHMSATEGQEEMEEVGEELRKKEEQEKKGGLETGGSRGGSASAYSYLSKIFVQSFTMTTLAEWGDRSQLATVILGKMQLMLMMLMPVIMLLVLMLMIPTLPLQLRGRTCTACAWAGSSATPSAPGSPWSAAASSPPGYPSARLHW
jgi:putative Ca2+/H+ antiporter (TMEM165/GDT1 family)